MSKIDKAVQWAINIAQDNTHGYSQAHRYGPDYDCSSMVIEAWQQAGVPVKTKGAVTTHNMYHAFRECGFADVTAQVDLIRNGSARLLKGDVLLNIQNHTCLYIGNNQVVNARTDTDGVQGDSHGDEIRIQEFWNYNPQWDCVLRYVEVNATSNSSSTAAPVVFADEVLIPTGTKGIGIAMLQGALKYKGYNLGWYGVDGDSGGQNSYTNKALKKAVSKGEISVDTIKYLLDLSEGT